MLSSTAREASAAVREPMATLAEAEESALLMAEGGIAGKSIRNSAGKARRCSRAVSGWFLMDVSCPTDAKLS